MVDGGYAGPSTIFEGSSSLRVRNEWRALLWSGVCIAASAPLLAYVFPTFASGKEIALLVIGAMIYVTFARGRLIGGSIRVHAGQFGHVYGIALECSRALRMPVPNVFVRDDPLVPIVAVGIGEPYSLIISAQWVEHLTPQELRFLIGRELAHIDAGHTRITSLLSVNGRENAIVSILFGAWLRRIEYTADRAGLLCCASLESALSAISVSTFHLVGRSIDLVAFAEQQREIDAERALRIGEWVSSTPYATKRIAALRSFARDALYLQWSVRFEEFRVTPFVPPLLPAGAVARRAYANLPRRLAAFVIDFIVIQALIPNLPTSLVITADAGAAGGSGLADVLHGLVRSHPHLVHALDASGGWGGLIVMGYYVLLVGFAGQTFGMMIIDLRVVSERFARVGLARAVARFGCLIGSMICVIGLVKIFSRIQPYEKWSGTRLIAGGAYIRSREKLTGQQLEAVSPLSPLSP
jgi:Zn-dependent protease with chaperone function